MVFRYLKTLLNARKISKIGSPPKVYYTITENIIQKDNREILNQQATNVIETNFTQITPLGEMKEGIEAFKHWCDSRGLDLDKMANQYLEIYNKYQSSKINQRFSAIIKMKQVLGEVFLNECFFEDFYSFEVFGKTKLGQLVLYAKQSQDVKLIKTVSEVIKPSILNIIQDYGIQAIGFIPPTIRRKTQFNKELELNLNLNLPKIEIEKILTEIIIPQKSLSNLEERKINAERTFIVKNNYNFSRILLIDDALGSGATLNEIAKKIKLKNPDTFIVGFTLVASAKGFDVISEV